MSWKKESGDEIERPGQDGTGRRKSVADTGTEERYRNENKTDRKVE